MRFAARYLLLCSLPLAAPAAPARAASAMETGARVSYLDSYSLSQGAPPSFAPDVPLPPGLGLPAPAIAPGPGASPASPYADGAPGFKAASSLSGPNAAALRDFLAPMKLIRIAVPYATGNGHQAVGATIAKRLRELGFEGDLEMLFTHGSKKKLELVLPGFDPAGPSRQRLPALNATATDVFPDAPAADLAISAADHIKAGPSPLRISVQPFRWGMSSVQGPNGTSDEAREAADKVIMFSPASPRDPAAFIAQRMSGSAGLREKIAGLQALVRGIRGLDLLPAYGLSREPKVAARLLAAVAAAQELAPAAFRAGAVVPFFSYLTDADLDNVRKALDEFGLAERVSFSSVLEPEAVKRALEEATAGRIAAVRVGGVNQDVFEYFYSLQTLPGAVAGANGQNLMRVLGKPYLVTSPGFALGLKDVYSRLSQESLDLFLAALSALESPTDALLPLARFLVEAKDPWSDVSFAFRMAQPTRLEHDKLALLLERAARIQASARKTP